MSRQPELGRRIREARRRKGLSQQELAGQDLSASYVSLVEAGRRDPTDGVLERLAARLDVEVEALRTGVTREESTAALMDLAFAEMALGQGRPDEAVRVLERVLEQRGLAGEPRAQFRARLALATGRERTGDLDEAVRELEALREQAEREPSVLPWLPVVTALSRCYRESGDLHRAVDLAEAALARAAELGLEPLPDLAQAASTLAAAYFERGDLTRAALLLDDLIERSTSTEDRQGLGAACWNAAVLAAERGHHAEALRLAERAAALVGETSDDRSAARLKTTRAWVLLSQPRPDAIAARELLLAALPELRQHASAVDVASAETELARAEALLGRSDLARQHAENALAGAGDDAHLEVARARVVLGQVEAMEGDLSAARAELARAADELEHVTALRQAAQVWRWLADLHASFGFAEEALDAYRRGLDAAGIRSATEPLPAPTGPQYDLQPDLHDHLQSEPRQQVQPVPRA